MKKRHYSNEFKLEAVRLSYKRENIKELANELGVQVQRIYKWRATHRETSSLYSCFIFKQIINILTS